MTQHTHDDKSRAHDEARTSAAAQSAEYAITGIQDRQPGCHRLAHASVTQQFSDCVTLEEREQTRLDSTRLAGPTCPVTVTVYNRRRIQSLVFTRCLFNRDAKCDDKFTLELQDTVGGLDRGGKEGGRSCIERT